MTYTKPSLILALTFLLIAAGCGDDGADKNPGNNGYTGNNGNNGNNGASNNGASNNGASNNNNSTSNNGTNGGSNNGTETCVDTDSDGYFVGCDEYNSQPGPDCNDNDADNWSSCGTCEDGDSDTFFAGCDAYANTAGPDCDDGDPGINPNATEIEGNGKDDDCDPTTKDAECAYTPVPASNPEPAGMAGVTAAHNYWRWRVGAGPLSWNSALAQSATTYAEKCIWEHDQNRSPDAGFSYVGENLYAGSGQPSVTKSLNSVESWADERFDYDFGTPIGQTGGAVVGHYTQLVWSGTTEVGCGAAYCASIQGLQFSGTIIACRYGAGGNYTGQLPYQASTGACLDLDNDDVLQQDDPNDQDRNTP